MEMDMIEKKEVRLVASQVLFFNVLTYFYNSSEFLLDCNEFGHLN